VTPVTGRVLDTLKETVTVVPVPAGFGVTPEMLTLGARGDEIISEVVLEPTEPLLSAALTVIV